MQRSKLTHLIPRACFPNKEQIQRIIFRESRKANRVVSARFRVRSASPLPKRTWTPRASTRWECSESNAIHTASSPFVFRVRATSVARELALRISHPEFPSR